MKANFLRVQQIPEQELRKTLHYEQELMLIDTLYNSFLYNYIVLNDYVVVLMITNGSIRVQINGVQEYDIHSQGILYHLPENVLQVIKISDDFQAKCIVMSKDFVARLGVINGTKLNIQLLRNPFLSLPHEALESLLQCYQMLKNLLTYSLCNPYLSQILQHILQAYMLTFSYYLHETITRKAPETNEEIIVYRFIDLLKDYGAKEHHVTFYANRLCITPKYFSRCVKAVTGIPAKLYIDKYLISYAQSILISSDIPLTELSYELGFSDPSNFNKFFRKHTGQSPNEFKKHT